MRIFYIAALIAVATLAMGSPLSAWALSSTEGHAPHISPVHPGALLCILIFIVAYSLVLFEEQISMRKSKPVMVGAALIWIIIAIIAPEYGASREDIHDAVFHNLDEYGALLLFLLSAMTYITTMENRNVFAVLRARLIEARLSMRSMFWATGTIAFFLSPVADNLTTALVMGAVIMAVGKHDSKFVALACINVVNAANAGGAFSPFGDITTLMVWQAGKVDFLEFFDLFIPAAVNYLVPAIAMSFFVSKDLPDPLAEEVNLKRGAKRVIFLGACTIATAVLCEQFLGLPPFLGMLAGLSFLMLLAYYLQITAKKEEDTFELFALIKHAEWDTLLFFYGVIFSVGGLSYLGYMELASAGMYSNFGPSITNVALGLVSAVIDNIPVMFAVLTMSPEMSHFQWLLVTLTTGVGGSMLSIGSAAGVALMGLAHGQYTFGSHLKWTPVIILGYIAAIGAHFLVNAHLMDKPGPHVKEAVIESVEAPAH